VKRCFDVQWPYKEEEEKKRLLLLPPPRLRCPDGRFGDGVEKTKKQNIKIMRIIFRSFFKIK
jgi:hypothetical protein